MATEEYTLKDVKLPITYTVDKENKYYRDYIPDAMFDPVYEKLKVLAVGVLSQADPEHAELYKSMIPDADRLLDPEFKNIIKDFFVGCTDPNSPIFLQVIRNMTGKMMTYLRFAKEREMYKAELDKIAIKKPLFIQSLPRSGSTYLHTLLSSDPKSSAIAMYEHFMPGSKTMSSEARIGLAKKTLGQVQNESKELNSVHNMDSVYNKEEETFFLELIGQCYLMSSALPRLEQLREHQCTRDFHLIYEALKDELKMHIMEFPLKEDGYLCLKSITHFSSMIPFFDVFGHEDVDARIVWIHREPVEQIKSFIILLIQTKGRFEHDLGADDIEWLNKEALKINELCLRNSIAARDAWIKEKPERAKRIYDVSFKDAVTQPKETVKKIYEYFGMDYTEEMDKCLQQTIEEGDPQRKHGRKKHDESLYTFNEDEVREQFKFYYDRFKEYLPNYYGKK